MHFQCYALAIFPTIVTRFNNSMEWKFSSKNWTRILGVYYNLDIHDLTIEIDTLVTIACNKAHTCIFQKIIKINFIWALIVYFRLFYFYFYSFITIYCFVKWGVVSFAELGIWDVIQMWSRPEKNCKIKHLYMKISSGFRAVFYILNCILCLWYWNIWTTIYSFSDFD